MFGSRIVFTIGRLFGWYPSRLCNPVLRAPVACSALAGFPDAALSLFSFLAPKVSIRFLEDCAPCSIYFLERPLQLITVVGCNPTHTGHSLATQLLR